MSAVSCAHSSTVMGTRFSAERVPRLSAVLDSCPPAVLCECPSAMPSGCFPAERVPRLSALLGSGLSPVSLIAENIDEVEASAWPSFDALASSVTAVHRAALRCKLKRMSDLLVLPFGAFGCDRSSSSSSSDPLSEISQNSSSVPESSLSSDEDSRSDFSREYSPRA
eukprot:4657965-Pleurochrysis_carterae.AAC.1